LQDTTHYMVSWYLWFYFSASTNKFIFFKMEIN